MDSDWILNFHIKLDFWLWMNEIQTGEGLLGLVSKSEDLVSYSVVEGGSAG